MKNLKLFAGLCLSMMATSAMAQQYMTVNFQDGKTVEYRLDDIKDVTFREAATIDPNEWQPTSVLGTVALGDNVDVNGWVTAIDARGFIL